jgi:hypothetical protein
MYVPVIDEDGTGPIEPCCRASLIDLSGMVIALWKMLLRTSSQATRRSVERLRGPVARRPENAIFSGQESRRPNLTSSPSLRNLHMGTRSTGSHRRPSLTPSLHELNLTGPRSRRNLVAGETFQVTQ